MKYVKIQHIVNPRIYRSKAVKFQNLLLNTFISEIHWKHVGKSTKIHLPNILIMLQFAVSFFTILSPCISKLVDEHRFVEIRS